MARLDMQMIEKERSEEYQTFLQTVIAGFDRIKDEVDLKLLKEVLKLVFKRLVILNRKIIDLQLYEPFKTFYEELNLKEILQEKLEGKCETHCSHRRALG